MANKTVSSLNELTTVSNSDVLLVETATETMKVAKGNLLKEVNEQLNAKSDVNHTHREYITEDELNSKGLATETFVTNKIAEAQLGVGDVDLSAYQTKTDNTLTTFNKTIVGAINELNALSKIEILEDDPVDNLFEGRMWVVINNNVSTPSISLYAYDSKSVTIKLDAASHNSVHGTIETYELYNDEILLEAEVINISQGGTYKINNLTPNTTYNIKLKGVLNDNKSEFSNTVSVSTKATVQIGDIPKDGLSVYLKGSDFTNSPQTTVLYDLSDNNNNATASGFNYTTTSGSNENGNIVFDGIDDKLVISQSDSISATNGFTMVFKGSINDLSQTNKEIIDTLINPWGSSGGGQQISLIYGYVDKTFELYGDSLPFRGGSQIVINDTDIHTVIYSYDGTTLHGYLDGVQVVNVPKSVSITLPIRSISIGTNTACKTFSKLSLGCYLFYNRGLTKAEVASIQNELL